MRLRSSVARDKETPHAPELHSLIDQAAMDRHDAGSLAGREETTRISQDLGDLLIDKRASGTNPGLTAMEASPEGDFVIPAELDSRMLAAMDDDPELLAQLRTTLVNLEATVDSNAGATPIFSIVGVEVPAECSLIAANLAVICARWGYRVLLVDANLNYPIHDSLLNVKNGEGVSELLSSTGLPQRFIRPTAVDKLSVITTGSTIENANALLERESLTHRLLSTAGNFDLILIDCGSLSPQLATRVAAGSTGAVLAAKEGISSIRELQHMSIMLEMKKVSASGVILMA